MGLENFSITRLSSGNLPQSTRWEVEAVVIGNSAQYTTEATTDTLTAVRADAHPFADGDRVWLQDVPGHPVPGGFSSRVAWVINHVASVGETPGTMQLSATQGGQPIDITSDSRFACALLRADYRDVADGRTLFGFKTNIAGELTEDQKREVIETLAKRLVEMRAENDGVL